MGISNHLSYEKLKYPVFTGVLIMVFVTGASFSIFWRLAPYSLLGKILGGFFFVLIFCCPFYMFNVQKDFHSSSNKNKTLRSAWMAFLYANTFFILFSLPILLLFANTFFTDFMIQYPDLSADLIIITDSYGNEIGRENRGVKFMFFGMIMLGFYSGFIYQLGKSIIIFSIKDAWLSTLTILTIGALFFLFSWKIGIPLVGILLVSQILHGVSNSWLVDSKVPRGPGFKFLKSK